MASMADARVARVFRTLRMSIVVVTLKVAQLNTGFNSKHIVLKLIWEEFKNDVDHFKIMRGIQE